MTWQLFWLKLIYIAAGGALGSVLRFLIQGWVQRVSGGVFPFGTLAVNLLGCLIIGFAAAVFASPILIREEHRIGLAVGILGGFTTFSTFGLETFNLAKAGQAWLALANVVVSCALGFAGVWLGYRLAERWYGV